jgi:hypothetical protein
VAHRFFFSTAAMLDPAADELRALNFVRPMTRPGELATARRTAGFQDIVKTLLMIQIEFANFDDYWLPFLCSRGGPRAMSPP